MDTPSPPESSPRSKLPPKLAALVEQYGQLAIWVFVSLSLLKWAGVLTAIFLGVEFQTTDAAQQATGFLGKLALAWTVSRIGVPFQLAAAVALTPVVARLRERLRSRTGA